MACFSVKAHNHRSPPPALDAIVIGARGMYWMKICCVAARVRAHGCSDRVFSRKNAPRAFKQYQNALTIATFKCNFTALHFLYGLSQLMPYPVVCARTATF